MLHACVSQYNVYAMEDTNLAQPVMMLLHGIMELGMSAFVSSSCSYRIETGLFLLNTRLRMHSSQYVQARDIVRCFHSTSNRYNFGRNQLAMVPQIHCTYRR